MKIFKVIPKTSEDKELAALLEDFFDLFSNDIVIAQVKNINKEAWFFWYWDRYPFGLYEVWNA